MGFEPTLYGLIQLFNLKMVTTRVLSMLLLFYFFVARLAYISYSNLINVTGKDKLNAVTSCQFPHFRHKMNFHVVASLARSCWLKRGYVCLSPPAL